MHVARRSLQLARMASRPTESWTIPLHIIMWTTLTVGFIMVLVVVMMH